MKSDKQHEYHPKEMMYVLRYAESGKFPSVHSMYTFVILVYCCCHFMSDVVQHTNSRAAYTTIKRVHIQLIANDTFAY